LADAERSGELNPPSLRGVSQQIRRLHDGRATTLRDVFTVFHHHGSVKLTPREIDDLQSFLRSPSHNQTSTNDNRRTVSPAASIVPAFGTPSSIKFYVLIATPCDFGLTRDPVFRTLNCGGEDG
jgi:hypothetical protein